ncbi:MAG: hypothetical protein FJW38_31130 [Acidobacteria bacterium]|nr:hypothetical protein [Acidobacteriota bacterium]
MSSKISQWVAKNLNFTPDKLQTRILDSESNRLLLCCSRQWGKSTVAAAKALYIALSKPKSLILAASASQRQSLELLETARALAPEKAKSRRNTLQFANGSRIVALPENPRTIRGFSAGSLVIIDEAAFVRDKFFEAITPTFATTNGALWLLSSAGEEKGFFYETWTRQPLGWQFYQATAADCPRISKQFLEAERITRGQDAFDREYFCKFTAGPTQFLEKDLILAAWDDSVSVIDCE